VAKIVTTIGSNLKIRRTVVGIGGVLRTARHTSMLIEIVHVLSAKSMTPTAMRWAKGREGRIKYRTHNTISSV
jgi:hypothetical protein